MPINSNNMRIVYIFICSDAFFVPKNILNSTEIKPKIETNKYGWENTSMS